MQDYLDQASTLMPRLLDLGINLVTAVLILILGWWLSAALGRMVRRASVRSGRIEPTIVPMVVTAVVWAVRIFTIIAVLARFGVQTASLIAVLGAAGLAVGLALQGTLQNIAAGIMLIALRPLRAGEYVSVPGGPQGTVEEVGLFLTRLTQFDGVYISVPNSVLWSATMINYSRNPTRRLDLEVPVRYGDNLDLAVERLRRLVGEHPLVLPEPAPQVMVTEYRENGLVVNLRMWCDNGKYWDLRFDLYYKVRQILDDAGLRAPVPVREIQGQPPGAAAQAGAD